jgi:hypothetical protein
MDCLFAVDGTLVREKGMMRAFSTRGALCCIIIRVPFYFCLQRHRYNTYCRYFPPEAELFSPNFYFCCRQTISEEPALCGGGVLGLRRQTAWYVSVSAIAEEETLSSE